MQIITRLPRDIFLHTLRFYNPASGTAQIIRRELEMFKYHVFRQMNQTPPFVFFILGGSDELKKHLIRTFIHDEWVWTPHYTKDFHKLRFIYNTLFGTRDDIVLEVAAPYMREFVGCCLVV